MTLHAFENLRSFELRCQSGTAALVAFLAALVLAIFVADVCQGQVAPPPPPPHTTSDEGPPPSPPTTGIYRIAGRVLDATDGRPLRHAGITVIGNGVFGGRPPETETDELGRFSVAGVPAGKFNVQASARGYITASYDEHENYFSSIVTGADVDTESLVFRLQPIAMIYGRVTDEVGDPVRNATVSLFHETFESGTRRITQFNGRQTNDLGEYEFPRLPAGTYYIAIHATPWYATFQSTDNPAANLGVVASVDPALNVGYPLTFYPEATESRDASPVRLKAGERFHANFRLTPRPALRISMSLSQNGSRSGPNEGRPFSFPQLQQKVFDSYEPVFQQRVMQSSSGFEIAGLTPGHYTVRQIGPNGSAASPPREVDLTTGSLSLDLGNSPTFGSVTLNLASLPSVDHGESGSPDKLPARVQDKLPASLPLVLRKPDTDDSMGRTGPTAQMKDGKAEFNNVEPGDYRIEPRNNRFHVDSVTEGGQTRAGALLHVTGEGQTATITLGTGSVTLSGYAQREGKGVSGAMMVLVPAAGDHSIDLYKRDQSNLDGSFSFAGVVPGNYLLVAIADGWTLEWGKPEELAPYLLKAVPITVASGKRGSVKIAEPILVQAR